MQIKSSNRQTIIKKAAATKCSRLFAYILCTMKTEMRVLTSARRRTRSGGPRTARTGAERRHRTFEPWQGSKKRTIPIWYRSFFKRETGIEPATPSLARRCSTTEPLAHNTNIKFAVAYKLAPTNISISDFNFCVNLFLQISCNFSATFVTNAPPIIKSAFAFIIKNHQKNRPPCESGKITSPFTQRSFYFN